MNKSNLNLSISQEVASIDREIDMKLANDAAISRIEFSEINSIITSRSLQSEVGFVKLQDGDFLVAMKTALPGVTAEMINWWFWWHPQESERYQAWFPGEHYSISYARTSKSYFSSAFNGFQENVQYPVERIGKRRAELSIEFVCPQKFGIEENLIRSEGIGTVVCGNVGILRGMIRHTKMLHLFMREDGGLTLVSRFWLGHDLPRFAKRLVANEKQAYAMAKHCAIEYTRLGTLLPEIYQKFR